MLRLAIALTAVACLVAPAQAQVQRNFPQNALRGAIVIGEAPEITLNGNVGRLSPGARIRDMNNMMLVPSAVIGGRYLVNYTIDLSGLVKDVWILRPAEAAVRPWPTTREQAAAWTFDPAAQTWSRP
ncbi:MAG: hypothetical protein ABI218_02120 [Caldimonas sp.]